MLQTTTHLPIQPIVVSVLFVFVTGRASKVLVVTTGDLRLWHRDIISVGGGKGGCSARSTLHLPPQRRQTRDLHTPNSARLQYVLTEGGAWRNEKCCSAE